MEKIIHSIKQHVHRSEKANEYFTLALLHLENNRLQDAKVAARNCYTISDNIEQRFAAIMLIQLSESKSHMEIMTVINDIYSYSEDKGGVVYGC